MNSLREPQPAAAVARRQIGPVRTWWTANGPLAVPRFIWALLLVAFALGLLYLAAAFVRPSSSIFDFVDLDGEANLPTWFASTQWFAIAAVLFAVADLRTMWADRRSWILWLLAAVFLGFSMDEVVKGHEYVGYVSDSVIMGGTRDQSTFRETGIWMLTVGVPFLAVFSVVAVLSKPYLVSPAGAYHKIVTGMSLFLLGAFGLEAMSNFVEPGSLAGTLEVYVEETLEMIGATIILWGACLLASQPTSDAGARADIPSA